MVIRAELTLYLDGTIALARVGLWPACLLPLHLVAGQSQTLA